MLRTNGKLALLGLACLAVVVQVSEAFSGGARCTIKNKQYSEYMYAPGDRYQYDNDRGKIATWTPGGETRESYWEIQPASNGEFTIKNLFWDKYMYVCAESEHYMVKDNLRTWVFYWKPGGKVDQGNWRFIQVEGGYMIESAYNYQKLYADGNLNQGPGGDRRGVFTWKGTLQGIMREEAKWIVDCK